MLQILQCRILHEKIKAAGSEIVSFPLASHNSLRSINVRHESILWLMASEVPGCGWLALLLWAGDKSCDGAKLLTS